MPPFQGLTHKLELYPRALPWAILFRPFGACGELLQMGAACLQAAFKAGRFLKKSIYLIT